jgi:hypothetical protein
MESRLCPFQFLGLHLFILLFFQLWYRMKEMVENKVSEECDFSTFKV